MRKRIFFIAVLMICICSLKSSADDMAREEIIAAANQNVQAIDNLDISTIIINSNSPDFVSQRDLETIKIVHGREAWVTSQNLLFFKPAMYIDDLTQKLISNKGTVVSRERYWRSSSMQTTFSIDQGQSIDDSGNTTELASTAYAKDITLPLTSFERLQLQSANGEIPLEGAKLLGKQRYRGLDCYKIGWGEEGTSENWSYRLISPERSYKTVYSTSRFRDGNTEYKQTTSIEEMRRIGDMWIPWQVRYESIKTKDGGGASDHVSKFRVIECKINNIDVDRLFEPLLSPGTHLYTDADTVEIVGGDTSTIIAQLQKGDFSILKEEVKDLSKP